MTGIYPRPEDWYAAPAMAASQAKTPAGFVSASGIRLIDSVLSGYEWKTKTITYAFPDSPGDYRYKPEKNRNFDEVSRKIQDAARFALDADFGNKANDGFSVEGFTGLTIKPGSDKNATIRYAESGAANPTAYAYLPNPSDRGGDIWFGPNARTSSGRGYDNAVPGNYEFSTVLHETGHALGLKHAHERENGFPKLPNKLDSLEISVMTYHSYAGERSGVIVTEKWGMPQSFMMADIAALQYMYGANYSTNSGDTVYSWKPKSGNTWVDGEVAIKPGANRIFATIWDGGGNDTYDLSAYSSNLKIDLQPGSFSVFSKNQIVDLGAANNPGKHLASGNIYNALLHEGDARSLIENAIGGRGNDQIRGNGADNRLEGRAGNDKLMGAAGDDRLEGGAGNDRLEGGIGNDILAGGAGKDVFVFQAGWGMDLIEDFRKGDRIDLTSFNFESVAEVLALAVEQDADVLIILSASDVLTLADTVIADLGAKDFVL